MHLLQDVRDPKNRVRFWLLSTCCAPAVVPEEAIEAVEAGGAHHLAFHGGGPPDVVEDAEIREEGEDCAGGQEAPECPDWKGPLAPPAKPGAFTVTPDGDLLEKYKNDMMDLSLIHI